jgi:hypothetical protein
MPTNRDEVGAGAPSALPTADAKVPPRTRQCSRCRASFPVDDSLLFAAEHAWWLCATCSDALLGRRAR